MDPDAEFSHPWDSIPDVDEDPGHFQNPDPVHMHRICKPATHSCDTFHLTKCILRYSSGGAGVEERRASEVGELAPTRPEFPGTYCLVDSVRDP